MNNDMLFYEGELRQKGYQIICGIDEAGRGPLAGPVYAAAVILAPGQIIDGVNDSKKLTPKKRDFLYDQIIKNVQDYGIGFADEKEVDSLNILNATFLAMKRAVKSLKTVPEIAIVDGNRDPKFETVKTFCLVKGDSKSESVAAASILAKVSRDRFMLEMAKKYPEYHFEQHKGYGTKLHYEMIEKYGICPIHRKTFLKKILKSDE